MLRTFLFTIGLILASGLVKADILSATLDYHSGEFDRAYKEFNRLALLGNYDAIYNLGVMNLHAQGVERSLPKAYAWFQMAVDFGLEDAQVNIEMVKKNAPSMAELLSAYKTLTEDFNYQIYSQQLKPIFVSKQYQDDELMPPERIHSVTPQYPKKAYEKGIEGWVWLEFDIDKIGAVKNIAILDAYPNRLFNRPILNAVSRWRYQPFSKKGQVENYGHRSLIFHFTTFKGERYQSSFYRQKREYQNKIHQLIEGAEHGNALIQYYVANWLTAEEHNATKLLKAHWHQESASSDLLLQSSLNNYPNAQYQLGSNLLRGEFTEIDRKKGLNWILHSAQGGFAPAQYRLATELLNKKHLEYDLNKAIHWLETAAQQMHFRAIKDLATLMLTQPNKTAEFNYYIELALDTDGDHPDLILLKSQHLLQQGKHKQALKWAKKAHDEAVSREWHLGEIEAHLLALKALG